jgi:hypothetical protein
MRLALKTLLRARASLFAPAFGAIESRRDLADNAAPEQQHACDKDQSGNDAHRFAE